MRTPMPEVQPSQALYYPHVEFGSAAWVKGVLLYWEKIARVVGYVPRDGDPEIRALVEAGLIEDICLTVPDPDTSRLFGERLETLVRQCGGLPRSIPGEPTFRGRLPDNIAKFREGVIQVLEQSGLRLAAETLRSNPERALAVYATFGAEQIGKERLLAPLTDDAMFAALTTYLMNEKVIADAKGVSAGVAAADLLIPTPSVEALASLPVDRLIAIRGKLAKQRHDFRAKVQAQAASVIELPTEEAVREHVKAFAAQIRDDVEAQREELRQADVKDSWSHLTATAPASLAVGVTLAQSAMPILGPVGGLGVVALGVTNWFLQHRKEQERHTHYLLSLDEALGRDRRGRNAALNALLSPPPGR